MRKSRSRWCHWYWASSLLQYVVYLLLILRHTADDQIDKLAGARQVATGLNIAKQYDKKVFVTSMCVSSGMGMAVVFVNEK
jgi:hypothetical protein